MKGEFRRGEAENAGQHVIDALKGHCMKIDIAGSIRRGIEIVGDCDILAVAWDERAMHVLQDSFAASRGSKVQTSVEVGGVSVDIWFVPRESWGAAFLFATGSALFNIGCRTIARNKAMKLSRYALSDRESDGVIARTDEALVLRYLGLDWIPPAERSVDSMDGFWRLAKKYHVKGLTDDSLGSRSVALAGEGSQEEIRGRRQAPGL